MDYPFQLAPSFEYVKELIGLFSIRGIYAKIDIFLSGVQIDIALRIDLPERVMGDFPKVTVRVGKVP